MNRITKSNVRKMLEEMGCDFRAFRKGVRELRPAREVEVRRLMGLLNRRK